MRFNLKYIELLKRGFCLLFNQQKVKNMISKKSAETGLPAQQLYGLFGMERLILKLSQSSYAEHLIVKGGFLLTTDLGLSARATRDIDFSVMNIYLSQDTMNELIDVITENVPNSNERFEYVSVDETREDFEYNGFNLKLIYQIGTARIPINVDITSGEDLIALDKKRWFKSIFTDEEYRLNSYPIEQVLTDKFYTLLAYGSIDDTNSRMKDYYDLYLLSTTHSDINLEMVILGLEKIMKQRDTFIAVEEYSSIIEFLASSDKQNEMWSIYSDGTPYAEHLDFKEVMFRINEFSNVLIEETLNQAMDLRKKRLSKNNSNDLEV